MSLHRRLDDGIDLRLLRGEEYSLVRRMEKVFDRGLDVREAARRTRMDRGKVIRADQQNNRNRQDPDPFGLAWHPEDYTSQELRPFG